MTKTQFEAIVKKTCIKANDGDLRTKIQSYKKMAALRDEIVKGNGYFFKEAVQTVRTIFRFRVELFEAKENYKNMPKYKGNMMCDSCMSKIDQNTHVLFCPSYSVLREGKSLNNDTDLAEYLQKVIEIRSNLDINR